MSDARLERLLHDTAAEVDYPETPDLAFSVIHRLTLDPLAPVPRSRSRWLRPAVAVAALVVGLAFALAFSPTVRRAAADLLGIVGIQISVDRDPTGPQQPASSDAQLDLGTRASVPAVFDRLGFSVKVPSASSIEGKGAGVFFDPSVGDTGMISFVYPHDAATYADVDILISQFRASVDEGFFKKVSATGGEVTFTEVNGTSGYWLSGEPHVFYYVDSAGDFREESVRLAGNVLLWEQNGIAHRIEGATSLDRALDIADSLR